MSTQSSGGTNIGTVALVVFIILKLVGVITWSWWWVLSPLWIGAGITLLILLVVLIASKIQ